MNFNTDGHNERTIYILNGNNKNKANGNFDNSFAKMKSEERRGLVQTTDSSESIKPIEETRGHIENFVVQNNHISNFGKKMPNDNYVSRALNNNKFKKVS